MAVSCRLAGAHGYSVMYTSGQIDAKWDPFTIGVTVARLGRIPRFFIPKLKKHAEVSKNVQNNVDRQDQIDHACTGLPPQ